MVAFRHSMHPFFGRLYTQAFFRSPIFCIGTSLVILFNAAMWALLAVQFSTVYQPSGDFIALHYKVFVGVDLASDWYMIFSLPLFGLLAGVLNHALSFKLYHTYPFLMPFFIATSLCVQLILLFALSLIIQVNIY